MKNKRQCQYCGKAITGRTDKRFCSDQCRSTFNYATSARFNDFKSKVNKILRKNRSILARLIPTGKRTVDKQILEDKKFNFNFYTTVYRTQNGNVYWFCYDYGFRKLRKDNTYQLVKWQPYMAELTMMITENNL